MFTAKRLFIILSAAIITILTGCTNNLIKKNGEIVFNFGSLYNKATPTSRNAIEDLIIERKDCFVDLALKGTYSYSDTFNLKEKTTYAIDDIPVGAQVKAVVEFYTFADPEDETTKQVLYSGESDTYVIQPGTVTIVVRLNKSELLLEIESGQDPNNEENGGSQEQEEPKVTIWVSYDENHQNNFWNDAENKSNEDPTRDGKTKDTGFYYIQSAVNWIAENGSGSENYEIKLSGTDDTRIFDQKVYSSPKHENSATATVIFGETEADNDNLNYHAKTITLTSENHDYPAINATHSPCILFRSTPNVPIYFENIKISTNNRSEIIKTTDGISSKIYLDNGTVFSDNSESESSGNEAIQMNSSTITMQGNSKIEKFYGSTGGAVWINYGHFIMEGDSRIENCKANSGGAIYLTINTSSHDFTMKENATIYKCTANDGGAIYLIGGSATIESGNIIECKANSSGGAINLYTKNNNLSFELKGGIIKDNEAQNGSAICMQKEIGYSGSISLIMSDDACVDLSNDIFSYGFPIKLNSTLTTSNEKAALVTFDSYNFENPNLEHVITTGWNGSQQDIQNSYTKFYARISNSDNDCYIDENGKLHFPFPKPVELTK